MQGWQLLIRNAHQDCLSSDSNGQTKQDLAVQHRQLCKHVQALQVSCCLHPPPTPLAVKHGPCLPSLHAFETKCLRKLLCISFLEHKTNDWVRSKINFLVGPQEPLLATVKRRKLAWFGHVTHHNSLSKTILQGNLEGERRRVRQRKCWMDNITESISLPMPELLTMASCRKDWKRISAASSLMSPRRPILSRDN